MTHDQDEALSLADLVAVMRDGGIAQCDEPQRLYAWPVDDELARFIGEANVIGGMLDGDLVETPLGMLRAHWHGQPPPNGSPVTILIRPEQIELRPLDDAQGLAGRIVRCGYHGHDAILHVQTHRENGESPLIVRTPGDLQLAPGANVRLSARGPVLVWPAPAVN